MNILFFTRLFYPHIGGVEKHLYEISLNLIERGYTVTVICEQHNRNVRLQETYKGIKILRIPTASNDWFKKFRIWKWLLVQRYLIKSSDIIHCHDVFYWYLPFKFLYPHKKVFTTFHGYEQFPLPKKAILIHKISEILSHGNICIGRFIEKWYGTKADYVLYGGVDLDKFKIKNSKLKINKSAVFIGRLDEQTGIKTYIDAYEIIKEKFPSFKLTIVGNGKYREYAKNKTKVLGFKKNPEKYLMKYQLAFVSRYLAILEAMAAKKLVFAVYDNEIKKDYLSITPFAKNIIIEDSAQKLADQILFFLKNPHMEKEIAQKAFLWVKNQTWEHVTDTYVKLWDKRR